MNLDLKKGEILQVDGESRIDIISGEVEVIGKRVFEKETITIPYGKSLPIEAIEPTTISIELLKSGKYEHLNKRTIPEDWDLLVNQFLKENLRIILILGGMDTGKSFLATYLGNKFLAANKKVAILDSDVGQSDIGPPTTIGLALLKEQLLFLPDAEVSDIYFVGSHSPSLHFLPMLVGIERLKEKALKLSDILIINTTGWIFGDAGRMLKRAKIEILSPDIIILLQRKDELEHIVANYEEKRLFRLKVSAKASDTSKSARKHLRELASVKYFKNSKEIVFSFDEIKTDRCYFKTGVPINIDNYIYAEKLQEPESCLVVSERPLTLFEMKKIEESGYSTIKNIIIGEEIGLLVGLLNKTNETLGLGILKNIDYKNKKIYIITPIAHLKNDINIIQFGSLKYTFDGREAGFIEPGKF